MKLTTSRFRLVTYGRGGWETISSLGHFSREEKFFLQELGGREEACK